MGRIFALFLLLAWPGARAMAQQDQKAWHILIEPAFMHPEISFPISGAKRTVLVPGYLDADGQPKYFTKKDWDAQKLTWDDFQAKASANVTDKKISGQLVRDEKKVVLYAALTSDSPLTATMVLAPDFLKKFKDIFGPKVLVAIPNRFTVYVFPSLASDYRNYAPMVIRAYQNSAYPVSLEVFEISDRGIKAIGIYDAGNDD
ncbi:MAG TPA: hypothetical protein VHY22_16315 [Chthoniobacteraceae bacterium]|jgi:hypothetical protein|nr:hypothetical protein [Chthoniobacteraceae bacterium]